MEKSSVETIVRALNEAQVRYLIVGGIAVAMHGYVRFTADFDLILDLEASNVLRAATAFERLEYRPRAPVPFAQFADADLRASWVRDKNLIVFSLWSRAHPETEIDLFVENPFDFSAAYARALRIELTTGVTATIIGLDDLLELKRQAARPKDLQDIAALQAAQGQSSP